MLPLVEGPFWKLKMLLSLCVGVPCPFCPVWRILFCPCVLMCCRHFVWQWCGGCCPNVDIDLCGWAFCRLVLKVLSGSTVTRVSRNGSQPCWVGSTVNCMCGSWLLTW